MLKKPIRTDPDKLILIGHSWAASPRLEASARGRAE